jgi:hypothetical protein
VISPEEGVEKRRTIRKKRIGIKLYLSEDGKIVNRN